MKELPAVKAVSVEFPFVTMNPIQFILAAFKCYPAMSKFLDDNSEKYHESLSEAKRPWRLEVYNGSLSKMNFYMPVEKAEEFHLTKMPPPLRLSQQEAQERPQQQVQEGQEAQITVPDQIQQAQVTEPDQTKQVQVTEPEQKKQVHVTEPDQTKQEQIENIDATNEL